MGFFTIIRIYVLAISFNLILPTGDIYSDIGLMVQTIKFQNSDSREMLGCRACYGKEEAEVERFKLSNCTTCITKNRYNYCGNFPSSINKFLEVEGKTICEQEKWSVFYNGSLEKDGECDNSKWCCFVTGNETNRSDKASF